MSIFSSILAKIIPSAQATTAPASPTAADAPMSAATPSITRVDVEALLDGMHGSGNLNWRTSIVDLMKLLGLDSSLQSRKQLAQELGYATDNADTAAMNIWLHRQVMTKLVANGGKVPTELFA